MEIIFGIQSAEHDSKPYSAQYMVNCYIEQPITGARSRNAIVSAYGISDATNISDVVAIGVVAGVLYFATSTDLYSLSASGARTWLANISANQETIIAGDSQNVLILNNGTLYRYSGTLTVVSTGVVGKWVGAFDGYYPLIEAGTNKFFINETAFTATTWNPLDFSSITGVGGELLYGVVDQQEVAFFGTEGIRYFYNSGSADFPFERSPSGYLNIGIRSYGAACAINNVIFFAGSNNALYMIDGYSPQRISTSPIERAIESYSDNCRCFAWSEGGHTMVAFKFTEGCFVYDTSTGLWHNRETYGVDTWSAFDAVNAYNEFYVANGRIGVFDKSVFTENGNTMVSSCVSQSISDGNQYVYHDVLWLNFETGNNGTVVLKYSDDGGRTWSNEKTASLGSTGEYKKQVVFRRLGRSRDRVYKYYISDAYRRTLINSYLNEYL